jgi:hypothetical protein
LTFHHQPISINPTLNLSPELITRFVALKSLLDLGDMDLVSAASAQVLVSIGGALPPGAHVN